MKIARAEIFQYDLPLATPIPLQQGPLERRTGYLLKLYDAGGHTAWGEAAPLPGFSRESLDGCRGTLVEAAESLMGRPEDAADREPGELPVFQTGKAQSAAYFAVESAWGQLAAAAQQKTPWQHYHRRSDETLLVNALLTGGEGAVREQAERAAALGYRAVKLKVGRERMTEDLQIVEMVRAIVGPDVELRLDANRVWSLEDAILFGKAARKAHVAYIEEPCNSPFDLPAFHEATGLDYALDESIQRLHDLIQEREEKPGPFRDLPIAPVVRGARAIIWKPTIVHSPELGKFLFHEARPGQTRILVLSGAFETGVGAAALASYAAMFSSPDIPVGLDTYRWIEPDILQRRLPLDGGMVDLNAIYQAGRAVDESRLTPIWPR